MNVSREYLGGISFDDESVRKFQYTCESTDLALNGLIFFSETVTKRLGFMKWGEGKTRYFLKDSKKKFKSIYKLCEFVQNKLKNTTEAKAS